MQRTGRNGPCRPCPSTERRSTSRSLSMSVTRPTNRSVTPRRDTRRSVTPIRRGRAGKGPLGHLEEETSQEVEELREYELHSFESQHEPNSQADMAPVTTRGVSKTQAPRDHHRVSPQTGKGRVGHPPVPPEAGDPAATLLHNVRWWFSPCRQGGMPPFRYDGAIDLWRKTVLAFSGDRVYLLQRDDPMQTLIP